MKLNCFTDFIFAKTNKLVDVSKIVERPDFSTFEYAGREYLVLTDREADELAYQRVHETLWMMDSDILSAETDIPVYVFRHLLKLRDDSTELIEAIIQRYAHSGLEGFMKRRIQQLGRGYILASFNHQQEFYNGLYFYRIS